MPELSGTYQGSGNDVQLVLRLDIDGASSLNMLSGELNQSVELTEFNYFNQRRHSFIGDDVTRSQDGNRLVLQTPIEFLRLPELTGTIEVELQPKSTVARLKLTGYGYHGQILTFALAKVSDYFRTVRLEIDREKGTKFPGPYYPWKKVVENRPAGIPEEPITIQTAFQRAGVEVVVHPAHSAIPPATNGTDTAWSRAELHAAMMNYFSLVSNDPAWNVYLLIGERYVTPGVSGIMFDTTDPLPRQGAAVFYSHYRDLPDGVRERNYVRTAVHELGHAMNLLHSFQKGVLSEFGLGENPFMMPRRGALSFMNYPWRYPYGHSMPVGWDGTEDYWARFRFEFDPLELMHVRHHDRQEVIFGGEPFGENGHSRVSDVAPVEIAVANEQSPLKLELRAKRVLGQRVATYELMEPVHLELKLACKGITDVRLVNQLDPSEGVIELYIQKPTGQTVKFRPMATTCFETSQEEVLKPVHPLYQDLNLTFGKDGFYFQEPGIYTIRAVYLGGKNLATYSNVLALRVGVPKTNVEESLATDFFDPLHGQLLAVGPSASRQFSPQIDFFREIVERIPDTATGKALAAYLGVVDGMPFKDVAHERIEEDGVLTVSPRPTKTIEAKPKEGLEYLNRALAESASPGANLGNLVCYQAQLSRARILEADGQTENAQAAIDELKLFLTRAIGDNQKLRERELKVLDEIRGKIGGKESPITSVIKGVAG